ncbi:MAG TPA: hypothetical protein VFN23_20910 [Ktedonobacteraceae bacterium]|nr:hypothetical protein [Ktedonobacteraceae bacterium]
MAVELDMIAEMEAEIERASQKSNTGNVFFFKIEDGQKALVRFLLDLKQAAKIKKHDYYNQTTGKYEVSALCAESAELSVEQCLHCKNAANNKKLTATTFFLIPAYVYGIKDAQNKPVVWKDQEGKEQPIQGIRYFQLKPTSPLLIALLANYREGGPLPDRDMLISRTDPNGNKLKATYTIIARAPSRFTAPADVEIPEQSADLMIQFMLEKNPPQLIGDEFSTPPVQTAGKVSTVPDF